MKIKLFLTAIILFLSFNLFAEIISSGKCGDNLTWTISQYITGCDGVDCYFYRILTISGTGEMYDYTPAYQSHWWGNSIDSVDIQEGVTSIGKSAFDGCYMTSVTIPNSVKSIGESAFSDCYRLKAVHISDIVSWYAIDFGGYNANPLSHGANLYLNGELVTDLNIPNSVTNIGNYAFLGCSSLTSVTIPNSVTSIGSHAFYGCGSLTSVSIPNSVKSIGESAFCYCYSLTSVTIPNSVTSIGEWTFNGCSSLTSITIPESITSIGDYAFQSCNALTAVHISDIASWCAIDFNRYNANPLYYAQNLYLNDELVTDLIIPESVEIIKERAFYNCNSLTSVTIPNNVISIGERAFGGCRSLTSITIPESVTSIGNYVFSDCSGLTSITIPKSVTSIGSHVFSGCDGLTSITIPNNVMSIGSHAFSGCSGLTSVTIPESVTSIGSGAFFGCNKLTSVIWKAKNCEYIDEYIEMWGWDTSGVFEKSPISSFEFGNEVEYITDYLCYELEDLTSVIIPNSVTEIGSYAFEYCSELEILVLGQSIKSIGKLAFSNCKRLSDIYCYAERVPDIYDDPFYNVSRKATLWVPANRLKNYQIDKYWSEFDVQPMSAEGANTDKVVVTPDYNTVDVIWPSENNADTYELIIKDKDGKEICSLIFNSIGQLQSIAFRAPVVDKENAAEQVQATGFRFTITGLDSGSQYSYTITAKDVAGKTLQTHTGTFYTLGATGVDDIVNTSSVSTRKVVENGNVYLLTPDGRKLNMQGAEVR